MTNVKEIITDELVLSERSTEIDPRTESKELRNIVAEIKSTMRKQNLTSLSAPAIGYSRRIFCINFSDLEIKTFVNPIICNAKGLQLSRESCSSIPGKKFIRPRNNDIFVYYQSPDGKPNSRELVGLAAMVFQHEIDHLDGLLVSDVGLEIDDDFDSLTDDEKTEIVNEYLDSLDIKLNTINQDIENDDETAKVQDAIKFINSVNSGETVIEKYEKENLEV